MKICPSCRRTYEDDGLNFCLEDGSVLTLASVDPAAPTVVMNPPRVTNQPAPVQTSWEAHPPGAYSMQPKKKSSKAWLWVLGIFGVLILLCGGGFAGFFYYVASVANSTNAARNATTQPSPSRANTFTKGTPSPSPAEAESVQEVDLSGWVKEFSIWVGTEYSGEEFFMTSKQKGYYYVLVSTDAFRTENATTRVTVRNSDDGNTTFGYGLIFHSDSTPLVKDYAFLIDSKKRRYRVVRHESETETTVVPWTNSPLIKAGTEPNLLEARDKGGKIELYINGQLATSVANKQGPTEGVPGLYVGDGAKIGFKKLEVAK